MKEQPPIYWLHVYFTAWNNGPDYGTGVLQLRKQTLNLTGYPIPQFIVDYIVSRQLNLLGGYPTSLDTAPSVLFTVLFFVLGMCHLIIWIINYKRGHYFWLSLAWVFYCALRVVGWALRAYWAGSILRVEAGIASEIFLIISSVMVVSFNLILAQRLFTWRHPVGGSRALFWNIMFGLYFLVAILAGVTVFSAAVPYVYFLSHNTYRAYKIVVMATSIAIILYSLTSIALIGLSYFFKPTRKDENLYTYQPWWIDSFHPLYFVKPHAAQEAEETFMKRNHNHRHAKRVIAATHHHYNMVEGLTNKRGDLGHNKSLFIVIATSLLIFIGAIIRTVTVFQAHINQDATGIDKPVVAYIVWGAFEVFVNLFYIVGRVDLRFYRPDVLPQKVRAIITAEQTYYPSEEEDEDDLEDQITARSRSETPSYDDAEKDDYMGHLPPDIAVHVTGDQESEFHF